MDKAVVEFERQLNSWPTIRIKPSVLGHSKYAWSASLCSEKMTAIRPELHSTLATEAMLFRFKVCSFIDRLRVVTTKSCCSKDSW